MNEEELAVMSLLAKAWNEFIKLPKVHPFESQEFMYAIHMAQLVIMARPEQKKIKAMTDELENRDSKRE